MFGAGGMHKHLARYLTIASAFVAEQHSSSAAQTCADLQATFSDVAPLGIARRLTDDERHNPKVAKLLDLVLLGVRHAHFPKGKGNKSQKNGAGGKSAGGGGEALVAQGELTEAWDAAVSQLLADSEVQAILTGLQVRQLTSYPNPMAMRKSRLPSPRSSQCRRRYPSTVCDLHVCLSPPHGHR